MAVAAATDVLPTPPFPVKRITRTTGQSRGAGRKPARGIWGPGGPNAPGPPTWGPRETRGFRGVGNTGGRAFARGPVGLFGRISMLSSVPANGLRAG